MSIIKITRIGYTRLFNKSLKRSIAVPPFFEDWKTSLLLKVDSASHSLFVIPSHIIPYIIIFMIGDNMNNDLMFSSKKQDWETPIDFFNNINQEFNFELDVCAFPENAKCDKYFTPEIDGLKQKWNGTCWMNPPYGREIVKWIKKAYSESVKGATVVCLIPARTDTKYWHEIIFPYAKEIRFIKGRLKFGKSKNAAPFPSALVIFDSQMRDKLEIKYI